jgi:hypothetical protein
MSLLSLTDLGLAEVALMLFFCWRILVEIKR